MTRLLATIAGTGLPSAGMLAPNRPVWASFRPDEALRFYSGIPAWVTRYDPRALGLTESAILASLVGSQSRSRWSGFGHVGQVTSTRCTEANLV